MRIFRSKKNLGVPLSIYESSKARDIVEAVLEKHGISYPSYGPVFDRVRFELPDPGFLTNGAAPLVFSELNGTPIGEVDIRHAIEMRNYSELYAAVESFVTDHFVDMSCAEPAARSIAKKWSLKGFYDDIGEPLLSLTPDGSYPSLLSTCVGDIFNIRVGKVPPTPTEAIADAPLVVFEPLSAGLLIGMPPVEFQPIGPAYQSDLSKMCCAALRKAAEFAKQREAENHLSMDRI